MDSPVEAVDMLLPNCCGEEGKKQVQEGREMEAIEPFAGQPQPYGRVHPSKQQVDGLVKDVASLRRNLQFDDPLRNWQTTSNDIGSANDDEMDLSNLKTWFPKDDEVAFLTPAQHTTGSQEDTYDQLTYRQLHDAIDQCPPFRRIYYDDDDDDATHAAIVLPMDQMAHMAMTLLSTMAAGAVAVPLDPRMPTLRVLEAMEQLRCTSFVASRAILLEGKLPLLERQGDGTYKTNLALIHECRTNSEADNNDNARLLSYYYSQLEEIRIVTCGVCGRLEWTVLEKVAGEAGDITWRSSKAAAAAAAPTTTSAAVARRQRTSSSPNGTAMLLRTSGTTAKPKVVPISKSMLAFAGTSIAAALKLKREDCNCNSMPFYHIGGIACNLFAVLISGGSVLLAGPLIDPSAFLDHLESSPTKTVDPTWYYAGPSMHKAILLMAESRFSFRNQLRCQVIPTYGMSEAMPICSSAPIDVNVSNNQSPCEVIDSVGYSVGTSVRILDPETDQVLDYGSEQIGEISVKGPGVILHYVGLEVYKTHTPDGWLKTGDRGTLDRQGRLFIKGRSKEMIKRGGEQVWPNEIDGVIEKVPGVSTAVTFGFPNELWGEEVAVAVVLEDASGINNQAFERSLQERIMTTCRSKLDDLSMPQQIKFLASTEALLKGSTGKYIRSKMATHLGVTAVDTGALKMLRSVTQYTARSAEPSTATTAVLSEFHDGNDKPVGKWDWLNDKSEDGRRVMPSEALNGLRFLVACFVVQVHVGLYPNLSWVKLQAYQPNMMIFFAVGAFQITCPCCSICQRPMGKFCW